VIIVLGSILYVFTTKEKGRKSHVQFVIEGQIIIISIMIHKIRDVVCQIYYNIKRNE
jgi:predicted ABC-type sugar transport system permease subunit